MRSATNLCHILLFSAESTFLLYKAINNSCPFGCPGLHRDLLGITTSTHHQCQWRAMRHSRVAREEHHATQYIPDRDEKGPARATYALWRRPWWVARRIFTCACQCRVSLLCNSAYYIHN